MDENPEIVGFDLGHGETALARTRVNASGEPIALDLGAGHSIVTAVGRDAAGHIAIGREVISVSAALVESYVRFKHPDFERRPEAAEGTRLFVRGVRARLLENNQVSNLESARFFVGCPSGWSAKTKRTYADIIRSAGLADVQVIPESRAAFLYARETRELSDAELSGRVLVIDIGSSTTDFTFSDRLNARVIGDFGHTDIGDVGAGLLDQAIFEHAIDAQPDRERIRATLAQNPGKRTEVDLKCRDAKHEYFNEKQGTGQEAWYAVRLERGLQIEIALDDRVMDEIKAMPIEELGGRSFVEAFRTRLANAALKLEASPDHIIVTGGAARMRFLIDLIAEQFPAAKLVRGMEPELAVAKGLAWFGRSVARAEAFRREVEDLVKSSKVEDIVTAHIGDLFSRIAESIAPVIVDDILKSEILRWRNGDTRTLEGMESVAKQRVETFLNGDDAKSIVASATWSWFDEIRPRIQTLTDPICHRYGKPASSLEISPTTHIAYSASSERSLASIVAEDLEDFGTIINIIVATVSGMVLGGAGIALMHLPLIGQIIAGIGVFAGLMVGKGALMNEVKTWDIPTILRKVVSQSKIDSKLSATIPEMVSGLTESLKAAEESAPAGGKLADRVASQIDLALRQRGEDAVLRF